MAITLTGKDWDKFSETTQRNIETAYEKGLDAIGLFMNGEFNPNKTIELLQSLSDQNYVGTLFSKKTWENKAAYNNGIANSGIEPLKEGVYSSHIVKSKESKMEDVNFPLTTNNSSAKTIYEASEKNCSRFESLIGNYSAQAGNLGFSLDITDGASSKSDKYYREVKRILASSPRKFEIFGNNNSNLTLNEYDKIVLISNIIAGEILNEFKNEPSFKDVATKVPQDKLAKVEYLTKDLLTIAIMRATDLGNPEVSYKIDEALKLQFANDMAVIASDSKDLTRAVVKLTKTCAEKIAEKLNFDQDRIVKNMEAMGFKYNTEPKTICEAIFNASNLEKAHQIEVERTEEIIEAEVLSETPAVGKTAHILATPVIYAPNLKKVAKHFKEILNEKFLTPKQKNEFKETDPYGLAELSDKIAHITEKKLGTTDDEIVRKVQNKVTERKNDIFGKVVNKYNDNPTLKDNKRTVTEVLRTVLKEEKTTKKTLPAQIRETTVPPALKVGKDALKESKKQNNNKKKPDEQSN